MLQFAIGPMLVVLPAGNKWAVCVIHVYVVSVAHT